FGGFQDNVPHEAIAHNDIHSALENFVAFDVPVKVERAGAQELGRLFDDVVPFNDLFPDIEKTNARTLDAINSGHQRRAHKGELQQVFGSAVNVGAKIEHGGGAPHTVRNGRGQ